jgi:hypothetical protein
MGKHSKVRPLWKLSEHGRISLRTLPGCYYIISSNLRQMKYYAIAFATAMGLAPVAWDKGGKMTL